MLFFFVVDLPLLILGQNIDSQGDCRIAKLGLEQRRCYACLLRVVADQVRQDVEDDGEDKLGLTRADVLRRHQFEKRVYLFSVNLLNWHIVEAIYNGQSHVIIRNLQAVEQGFFTMLIVQAIAHLFI